MTEVYSYPPKRDPKRPLDPPPDVLRWAAEKPVVRVRTWDGTEAWLILRYQEVRAALTDDRFSADPTRPGFPEKSAAYKEVLGKDRNLRTLDNPEHAVQKRMVLRDFTVKRVEEIRPAIQAKINGLIDAMEAKGAPVDIVTDFALPVPTMVICELLGVPYQDRDYFGERSALSISAEVPAETAAAAGRDLYQYMEKLIDEKDRNPQNDLTSRLTVEQLREGKLSRKDLIELGRFILIAGHETTANMIALSTLALLLHPEQRADLERNIAEAPVVANAVEELLRYLSVTHTGRRRIATADVVIGGQLIKAGEGIIVANNVSDREEGVFPDAARLDIRRKNANAHMAFGYGIHQCLGQLLSRVELQLVHSTLWKRLPGLALAVPVEQLEFREESSVYGVRSLPVTWERRQ